MPPRGAKKGASKPEAEQATSFAASQRAAGGESLDVGNHNVNHYAMVQEALALIEACPGLKDVKTAKPLTLACGATIAPFCDQQMRAKDRSGETYLCGCNFFLTCPLRDASPGVPLDTASIRLYTDHSFANVNTITTMRTIEIGVEASEQVDMANLQRVSPSEPLHALLFACARDLREITAVSQAVDEGRAEEDATTATSHA